MESYRRDQSPRDAAGRETPRPAQSAPAPSSAAIVAQAAATAPQDATRDLGRTSARDGEYVRQRPREPHEKYAIDQKDMPRGMDLFFGAAKIRGALNPRFNEYIRAGWRPARAADYPALSGYNVHYDQSLIDLGYARQVAADDPVVDNDLVLLTRPKAMSEEARKEDIGRARQQINDHMERIGRASRRSIGDKTRVSREYGPPDHAPEDSEVEL